MVWCSVFCLLLFFFPGQLQWNLHAEENTYCLRIIHNKHLKEGSMLRWKLVEKLVLCVSGERNIVAVWPLQTVRGDYTLYKRTPVVYALYLKH